MGLGGRGLSDWNGVLENQARDWQEKMDCEMRTGLALLGRLGIPLFY